MVWGWLGAGQLSWRAGEPPIWRLMNELASDHQVGGGTRARWAAFSAASETQQVACGWRQGRAPTTTTRAPATARPRTPNVSFKGNKWRRRAQSDVINVIDRLAHHKLFGRAQQVAPSGRLAHPSSHSSSCCRCRCRCRRRCCCCCCAGALRRRHFCRKPLDAPSEGKQAAPTICCRWRRQPLSATKFSPGQFAPPAN